MDNKRLIFIIPHMGKGGAEKLASLLLRKFYDDNYELYTIIFEENVDYEVPGKIININSLGSKNVFFKIYNFIYRLYQINKLIKQIDPVSIISFLEGPNFLNVLLSSDRAILTIHESRTKTTSLGKYKIIDDFIVRYLYKKAKKIVAVSEGIKFELVTKYKVPTEKVQVIYNPVDISAINEARNEEIDLKFEQIFENPVLINVGRLSVPKGQKHLVRVFNYLKSKFENLQLVIVGGEGEIRKEIISALSNSQYSKDIHYLGFQKNPYKFIARSKLYISSSLWEGFGISIVEALACGIPVISTDCRYGPREILSPGSSFNYETKHLEYAEFGLLVPVPVSLDNNGSELTQSEAEMANAIDCLLQDENMCTHYSNNGKKRAMDFQLNAIYKSYENISSEL